MSPERYPYNAESNLDGLSRHEQRLLKYGVWRCPYCGKRKPSGYEPELWACCGEMGHCTVELETDF